MKIYAESSAVLAWLFREPDGPRVKAIVDAAEAVVTSDLTLVECDRSIHRQIALGRITADEGRVLAADLSRRADGWTTNQLTAQIVARARQPFPFEPIRSLDALHVASVLDAKSDIPDLLMLTLDARVRQVAQSVGIELQPL